MFIFVKTRFEDAAYLIMLETLAALSGFQQDLLKPMWWFKLINTEN